MKPVKSPNHWFRAYHHRAGGGVSLRWHPSMQGIARGVTSVLVNSNPATIMTDPGIADIVYIERLYGYNRCILTN